ncbi:MAG: hypothetical protein EOM26_09425 [Alphaproteobacteria bacterium]|nr:hypothetical protein [Alphaproteobacteria bacterium]
MHATLDYPIDAVVDPTSPLRSPLADYLPPLPYGDYPEDDGVHRLYGSPETIESLGWIADRLPEWAGMDVTVIGRDDVFDACPVEFAARNGLVAARMDTLEAFNDSRLDRLLSYLIDHNVPVTTDSYERVHQTSLEMLPKIEQQAPAAVTFSAIKHQPHHHVVIVLPDMDASAEDMASLLTSIPSEELQNVPGGPLDWQAFILAHEAAHADPHRALLEEVREAPPEDIGEIVKWAEDKVNRILTEEIGADQFAIDTYREEIATGRTLDPEVPQAFVEARAIGSILCMDFLHASVPALRLESFGPADADFSVQDYAGFQEKVGERIALMTNRDPAFVLFRRHDPELLYKTIDLMDREGAFDDHPGEKAYVDRFLTGAARYAPNRFDVTETRSAVAAATRMEEPTFEEGLSAVFAEALEYHGFEMPETPAPQTGDNEPAFNPDGYVSAADEMDDTAPDPPLPVPQTTGPSSSPFDRPQPGTAPAPFPRPGVM